MRIKGANSSSVKILNIDPGYRDLHFGSYGPMGVSSMTGHRKKNDDCCVIDPFNGFVALSDGIGGAAYGDALSRVGCIAAMRSFKESPSLDAAFSKSNRAALDLLDMLDYSGQGSGATLLLATCFKDENIEIVSAGDSAAVHFTDRESCMICGRLQKENAPLTSGIGFKAAEQLRRYSIEVSSGDAVVFCTDGVTDALDLLEIREIIQESTNAPEAASLLASKAAHEGSDNATAVVVYI